MGTCKVCGGAILASNEAIYYSGPICNNPYHGNVIATNLFTANDNTSLLNRLTELELRILKLASAHPEQKEGK